MKFFTLAFLLCCVGGSLVAQVVANPFVGIRTHETLKIEKIDRNAEATIFYMSIENLRSDGEAWFCADKNIYIKESGNENASRLAMVKSVGIPTCPSAHKFTKAGEKLSFELHFPPLAEVIQQVDLVEDCVDNCFKLEEIALSPAFNSEMSIFQRATNKYTEGYRSEALRYYSMLLETSIFPDSKHYAYTHYIIPVIYYELGDHKNAKHWFERLKAANVNNKYYFIETIKEIEFFKNI